MDQCNRQFNKTTVYLLLLIMYWIKLTVCWKLDNYNLLYRNQDILYNCPLNSMCRCFPNETKLLEINCNEVTLYKFPGESNTIYCHYYLFIVCVYRVKVTNNKITK